MRALLSWRIAGCEVQTMAVGAQDLKEAARALVERLGDSARHLVFMSVLADTGDTCNDGLAYVHSSRASLRLPAGCNPSMVCAGMMPDPAAQAHVAMSVASEVLEAYGLELTALPDYEEPSNGLVH